MRKQHQFHVGASSSYEGRPHLGALFIFVDQTASAQKEPYLLLRPRVQVFRSNCD
jgi:hypothetical protein